MAAYPIIKPGSNVNLNTFIYLLQSLDNKKNDNKCPRKSAIPVFL